MSCFQPPKVINSRIEPSTPTIKYRLGLVLLTLVMVSLAAVYLGMIAALVYGVIYHFRHHVGASWLVYYGVGIGGSVMAFFLVKPILARRPPEPNRFTLTDQSDPELFRLIARISELVGVPLPSRVDVDCRPNAFASYREGWRSIRGNDLVLTIGLPLAEALTVQELAGVIAHELGHFSQRHGMRLTYVVRSLNGWFARVVYERDMWDVLLVRMAHGIDPKIGWFFFLLRICIWLGRRVLWGLMHVGNFFGCFMLRQMEFDADSYDAKVAGSAAFVRTSEKLRALTAASELVANSVRQSWQKRSLPDNLPGFINFSTGELTSDLQQKVHEAATKTRTGIFDSHPCDAARVKAAVDLRQPGIITDTAPAARLFNDLAGLCKMATRYFYEGTFEMQILDRHLYSHEAEAREKQMKFEAGKSLQKFLLEVPLKYRCVHPALSPQPEIGVDNLVNVNAQSRAAMIQLRPSAANADRELEEAESLLQRGLDALAQNSQQATGKATAKMDAVLPILAEYENLAEQRMASALELLRHPGISPKIKDAPELQKQLEVLLPVYQQLTRAFQPLQELRRNTGALNMALNIAPRDKRAVVAQVRIAELAPVVQKGLVEIKTLLQELPESHREVNGDTTIANLAKSEIPSVDRARALVTGGRRMTDDLLSLTRNVLGRLAWIALRVEPCLESNLRNL